MPNNAVTTVTVWSDAPAALDALAEAVAGPSERAPTSRWRRALRRAPSPGARRAFSLEAVAPTGMTEDAWDADRATALWGCSRPETDAELRERGPDRLVYELVTPWAPPETALATLSGAHPDVVLHAVTTCESEYAVTAWYRSGARLRARERQLELTDEQWDDWDGEWDLPDDWAFDPAVARRLGADGV